VKQLISIGKIDEAKKDVKELRGRAIFHEAAELLKGSEPAVFCPECGESLGSVWLESLLLWSTEDCKPCKEKANTMLCQKAIDEHISRIKENIQEYLTRCGVPRRFLSADISHFPTKMNIMANPDRQGWYITGPRGTGKTHLAVALIVEHALRTEYKVDPPSHYNGGFAGICSFEYPMFIPITELLLEIRDTFRKSGGEGDSEKDIVDRYSSCPLLVLDDLGVEKQTDWSMQTLYTLIDRRYREEMRTIITSNLSLDQLSERVDDRISSRIAGMCKIQTLKGKDRRIGG